MSPDRKTVKTTVYLFDGQYQRLQEKYKNAGGAAAALRKLIDLHIEETDTPPLTQKEIDSIGF